MQTSIPAMPDAPRALRAPRAPRAMRIAAGLAIAVLVLMLVVTTASAWLRLAQPRPACGDWPACRSVAASASLSNSTGALGESRVIDRVRSVHRVAATAVLLLVCALLVALARRPREARDTPALGWAVTLLVLALALSVLGWLTPGSRSAWVLLGNLLGGLMMLAAAASLLLRLLPTPEVPVTASRKTGVVGPVELVDLVALLWLLQVSLGALSGAALLRVAPPLHLALAMGLLPAALVVGAQAWRRGHRWRGGLLLGLTMVQAALGMDGASDGARASTVLLHNMGAAAGLALLATLRRT